MVGSRRHPFARFSGLTYVAPYFEEKSSNRNNHAGCRCVRNLSKRQTVWSPAQYSSCDRPASVSPLWGLCVFLTLSPALTRWAQ